ncbi:MAG: M55 family metallopeptidase [Bacillota bacterium]
MNAATAGEHSVPVVLVTGDATVCAEARALLGDIQTAAVKEHVGRYAANNLHPEKARGLIREAAQRALKGLGKVNPFKVRRPVRVELKFNSTALADGSQGPRCKSPPGVGPRGALFQIRSMAQVQLPRK